MNMKRRKKIPLPSSVYLNECLSYDPDTGILTWKNRPATHFIDARSMKIWNTSFAGRRAGSECASGFKIGINGVKYMAHRIAWVISGRELPPEDMHLDHIDTDVTNNRLINLRPATHAENKRNTNKPSTNKSGRKGVCWCSAKQKWQASIRVDDKIKFLGYYTSVEEAANAYTNASIIYYGEFARS